MKALIAAATALTVLAPVALAQPATGRDSRSVMRPAPDLRAFAAADEYDQASAAAYDPAPAAAADPARVVVGGQIVGRDPDSHIRMQMRRDPMPWAN